MKYWEKLLSVYKPLEVIDDQTVQMVRETYEEGLSTGYSIGITRLTDEIVEALENHLAGTKMKKKHRNGYLEAIELVYTVCDRYEKHTRRGIAMKPYWTATNSWQEGNGSVSSEWNSFD